MTWILSTVRKSAQAVQVSCFMVAALEMVGLALGSPSSGYSLLSDVFEFTILI